MDMGNGLAHSAELQQCRKDGGMVCEDCSGVLMAQKRCLCGGQWNIKVEVLTAWSCCILFTDSKDK